MKSPFEFGRELGSAELVDRADEVEAVSRALLGAGKLFLIGPRRHGKTSIVRAATEHAEAHGATVLRYDAEAFPTTEQLAGRILTDAAARLTPTVERAGSAIREFFGGVRPTATFDATENRWSVSLAGAADRAEGAPLLADILDGVEKAARRSKQRVALVIDEFQKLVEQGGREAEGQLRAAIQRHRHVGYVFAGSATRLLSEMTLDAGRPFYRLGDVRFVGPVPRTDFAAFLTQGFADAKVTTKPGAIDALLDAAEEVPYNVQLLAHACWERCRAESPTARGEPLTPEGVQRARDTLALRHDPLYTQLWSSLSVAQQKTLLALIRERGDGLASTAVARRYGTSVPTMQTALRALESKSVIREDPSRGSVRYRLEDPLFAAWIKLVVPR